MPNTLPLGSNPFLILLAIIKSPSLTVSDVDKLQVLANDFAETLQTLSGAETTLENLADDMDFGEVEYYGYSTLMRKQAGAIRRLRLDLKDFLAGAFSEKAASNSKKGVRHE